MPLVASASCASLRKTSLLNTPRCVSVNVFHRVAFLLQDSAALTMPASPLKDCSPLVAVCRTRLLVSFSRLSSQLDIPQ